jgi:hypothetical protein
MVVDKSSSRPKRSRGMQHRRVLVGEPRQFIEPAAGQRAEAVEMGGIPRRFSKSVRPPDNGAIAIMRSAAVAAGRMALEEELLPRTNRGASCDSAARGGSVRMWSSGDRELR